LYSVGISMQALALVCRACQLAGLFAILSNAAFTRLRNSDSASTWLGYFPASNRAATRVKIC
jgi:hypothetical protein